MRNPPARTQRTNVISQDLDLRKNGARTKRTNLISQNLDLRKHEIDNPAFALRKDAANKSHFAESRLEKERSKSEKNKPHFAESTPKKASLRIVQNP